MSYDYLLKDGDLSVSDTGEILLATTKLQLARQSILISLTTLLGEWFLDQSEGVDWLGILSRRGNQVEVDLSIKSAIKKSSYVVRLIEYSSFLDRKTLKYSVSFKALIETGEVLIINDLEI